MRGITKLIPARKPSTPKPKDRPTIINGSRLGITIMTRKGLK